MDYEEEPALTTRRGRWSACILPANLYVRRFRASSRLRSSVEIVEESRRGPAIRADKPAIGMEVKGTRACRFTSMFFWRARI